MQHLFLMQENGRYSPTLSEMEANRKINCGHQQFLFVPNISSFEREKIPKKENDALYEESQKQRYLERQIREAKREKSVLENGGASKEELNKAQRRISERQAKMREFTKETDRRRDYSREKVMK